MKSGLRIILCIVIAVVLVAVVATLLRSVLGYALLFLAALGAIVVIRQFILGRRIHARLNRPHLVRRHLEKRAHRELKELEKRIRR